MKITLCGSMSMYHKMVEIKDNLEEMGHTVFIPNPDSCNQLKKIVRGDYVDTYYVKKKYDYITKHYKNIKKSDCILVVNISKNHVKNYIGGNTFLEMGFAFVTKKPIYLYNELPNIKMTFQEMKAMSPIVINKNLSALHET